MTLQTNMSEMPADITTFKFQNSIMQTQLKVLLSEAELTIELQSPQGLCHRRAPLGLVTLIIRGANTREG